jgi:hypothetical protein
VLVGVPRIIEITEAALFADPTNCAGACTVQKYHDGLASPIAPVPPHRPSKSSSVKAVNAPLHKGIPTLLLELKAHYQNL